eukprot:m.94771 g.94771  ORF g.94771 m.94771 type:complete len:1031 (+) comp15130_c0_seq6:5583-8675(+)
MQAENGTRVCLWDCCDEVVFAPLENVAVECPSVCGAVRSKSNTKLRLHLACFSKDAAFAREGVSGQRPETNVLHTTRHHTVILGIDLKVKHPVGVSLGLGNELAGRPFPYSNGVRLLQANAYHKLAFSTTKADGCNAIFVHPLQDGCNFKRFSVPHQDLGCFALLPGHSIHTIRVHREADDVVVVAEKVALCVCGWVVNDGNAGNKVDDLARAGVKNITPALVPTVTVHPFQAQHTVWGQLPAPRRRRWTRRHGNTELTHLSRVLSCRLWLGWSGVVVVLLASKSHQQNKIICEIGVHDASRPTPIAVRSSKSCCAGAGTLIGAMALEANRRRMQGGRAAPWAVGRTFNNDSDDDEDDGRVVNDVVGVDGSRMHRVPRSKVYDRRHAPWEEEHAVVTGAVAVDGTRAGVRAAKQQHGDVCAPWDSAVPATAQHQTADGHSLSRVRGGMKRGGGGVGGGGGGNAAVAPAPWESTSVMAHGQSTDGTPMSSKRVSTSAPRQPHHAPWSEGHPSSVSHFVAADGTAAPLRRPGKHNTTASDPWGAADPGVMHAADGTVLKARRPGTSPSRPASSRRQGSGALLTDYDPSDDDGDALGSLSGGTRGIFAVNQHGVPMKSRRPSTAQAGVAMTGPFCLDDSGGGIGGIGGGGSGETGRFAPPGTCDFVVGPGTSMMTRGPASGARGGKPGATAMQLLLDPDKARERQWKGMGLVNPKDHLRDNVRKLRQTQAARRKQAQLKEDEEDKASAQRRQSPDRYAHVESKVTRALREGNIGGGGGGSKPGSRATTPAKERPEGGGDAANAAGQGRSVRASSRARTRSASSAVRVRKETPSAVNAVPPKSREAPVLSLTGAAMTTGGSRRPGSRNSSSSNNSGSARRPVSRGQGGARPASAGAGAPRAAASRPSTSMSSASTATRKGVSGATTRKTKTGEIPAYLRQRKEQWRMEQEEIAANVPDPDCPEGHVLLSERERREGLAALQEQHKELSAQRARMPLTVDTLRHQREVQALEGRIATIEQATRMFSKPKVYVRDN